MHEPMEAFMRLGIVHFMAFPHLASGAGPWEETVKQIALDPFFHAIEITHIEDSEARDRVKDLINLAHMGLGYAAHPTILGQGLDINALEEEGRKQACEVLREGLDEAISMGAETFLILSGKDPGAEKREKAVEALIISLGELCAYASSKGGPKIVVEAFDTEVDKCCLLGPSSLAKEVAQEVGKNHSNFGLLVDLSHIPLLKQTPQEALVPIKEHLVGIHLGNAVTDPAYPGYGDNHPAFGTPGGVNDVPEVAEFLRTLLETGFLDGKTRPIVSFEIKPMEGQDPEVVIANAKRVITQAWAMV